jgi:hypothetical protein
MIELESLQNRGEEIQRWLHLKTFPFCSQAFTFSPSRRALGEISGGREGKRYYLSSTEDPEDCFKGLIL